MAALLAALVVSSIGITIDQAGGLSAAQHQLVVAEIRESWSDGGVEVTSVRRGALPPPGQASVSLRIVTFSIPPNARGEHTLAWVAVGRDGLPAPILFVSLPAIAAVLADTDVGG